MINGHDRQLTVLQGSGKVYLNPPILLGEILLMLDTLGIDPNDVELIPSRVLIQLKVHAKDRTCDEEEVRRV